MNQESKRKKQQQALEKLRKAEKTNKLDRDNLLRVQASFEAPLENFFDLDSSIEAESRTNVDKSRVISDRINQVKRQRNEKTNLTDETLASPNPEDIQDRNRLLQEVFSEHFQKNIKDMLSSDPDFDLSATSPEEIEEYKKAVEYRRDLLKVILSASEREYSKLEAHIRNIEKVTKTE